MLLIPFFLMSYLPVFHLLFLPLDPCEPCEAERSSHGWWAIQQTDDQSKEGTCVPHTVLSHTNKHMADKEEEDNPRFKPQIL